MTHIAINDRVIDLDGGRVYHGEESLQLSPRLLALLNHFVQNADEVLSHAELIAAVWTQGDTAENDAVNVAVWSLRRAIGDDRRPHRILRSVPRRGFLFEPEFERLNDEEAARRRAILIDQPDPEVEATGAGLDLFGRIVLASMATVVLAAAAWWFQPWSTSESVAAAVPAVAVLPFVDSGDAGDQPEIADDLAEGIIDTLSRSPDLEVVARATALASGEGATGLDEIGASLRVDAVLEASVERSDNRVRVLAQLVDADSAQPIWSRSYDRPGGELTALHDDIANDVARALLSPNTPDAGTPVPRTPTD